MTDRTFPNDPRIPDGPRGRCVALRLQRRGVCAIARELGLSPSTVSEHLAHPDSRRVLDAAGRRALEAARDELADTAPELVRKALRVALGRERATPQQLAATRFLLTLAGLEPARRVDLGGSLDLRAADTAALRARLDVLRGVGGDDFAEA